MVKIIGIKYGRGATAEIHNDGPALAPDAVHQMFPNEEWTFVTPDGIDFEKYANDRFGENALIQQRIYDNTPRTSHILIGGDHSVNFGHFAAVADTLDTDDLCLVYIDAHLDIHTPETSRAEASGSPHGTNVRALLGDGDVRWLNIPLRRPVLKPENLFYIGIRSFEPAEHKYIIEQNIDVSYASDIKTISDIEKICRRILDKIGNRPFVVSFDFDAINPQYFSDVWVPESGGLTIEMCKYLINTFNKAYSFEFVEYAPTQCHSCYYTVRELVGLLVD
ncbi:MAG: arginase family protein [Alphaproteobacteria bacterium]